jgi:hypothetical protein
MEEFLQNSDNNGKSRPYFCDFVECLEVLNNVNKSVMHIFKKGCYDGTIALNLLWIER